MQIQYDNDQSIVIEILKPYIQYLNDFKLKKSFLSNLFIRIRNRADQQAGIYLYGRVGSGKTMLMQNFYASLMAKKRLLHFSDFMQSNYQKLHLIQKNKAALPINSLAKIIKDECDVLCLDEFEIKDIADAMIIAEIFQQLINYGVFIFVTTNTKPDDLYKDGLQRNLFMLFITVIKNKFRVINLDGSHDYRLDHISNQRFFKLPNQADMLRAIISQLTNNHLSAVNLTVFGRILSFESVNNKILVTDFAELINRDLGYNDFIVICQYFKIIIFKDLESISDDDNNKIRRFINFIDNVYFNKVELFLGLKVDLDKIYMGDKMPEFKRTLSRLNELK